MTLKAEWMTLHFWTDLCIAIGMESRNLPFFSSQPFFQVLCKRDYAAEAEVQSWIESVLGQKFPEGKAYEDALKDGVILCRQEKQQLCIISGIQLEVGRFLKIRNC